MISLEDIVEFYRLRQRGFSKFYIVLVLTTINLFSISILLDVAKFFLAVPLLQIGIVVLIITLTVGLIDKLRLEKGRSHLFLILVESMRVTSYTILPILMIFVAVLFYLGAPSTDYFENLKGVVSMLSILLMVSVLSKIFVFQIKILVSPFEENKLVKYLLYFGSVAIALISIASYILSDIILPPKLAEWFMYLTFIFFLELVFLYLSAEVALNYRTSVYVLMFLSYFAVLFFSLTGCAEILRLSYTMYGQVFPKIVTGVFLLSINAHLMDSRIKQFFPGKPEAQSLGKVSIEEILSILESIKRDVNLSKKMIEKQDDAIRMLAQMIEKISSSSSGMVEELRKELKTIRPSQVISETNTVLSKKLAEEILRLCSSYEEFSMVDLAGFILGPRPPPVNSKRAMDVENISPIPLFIIISTIFFNLEKPVSEYRIHQKDLAELLVSYHPHFRTKWSRRTAQNFVNSTVLKYIRNYREGEILFSIKGRGSIELSNNSLMQPFYQVIKDYIYGIGRENFAFILISLPKTRELIIKELKIAEKDLKMLF
ncbi:MAG: hypothetical protein FGF52_03265 [Candidatus Brockarchaeota archaeon]|nr:hypothetical protein [Candidatus Brockarchaeota archaeon]